MTPRDTEQDRGVRILPLYLSLYLVLLVESFRLYCTPTATPAEEEEEEEDIQSNGPVELYLQYCMCGCLMLRARSVRWIFHGLGRNLNGLLS